MQRLYRDYDQAGLDAQYNLRARVPEHPRFFERWAQSSEAVRHATPALIEHAWGAGGRHRLFLAPAAPGAPLFIFIHGGYWQALSKEDFCWPAPAFLDRGIGYAAIGYDLCPAVSIGEIIDQTRRAIAWIAGASSRFGIDAGRIVVGGHSAGGHLAAMAAVADWTGFGLAALPLRGVVAVSGVFDLEPLSLCYHQAVLNIPAKRVADWSPIRLRPPRPIPVVAAVGSQETDEFLRQQADFVAAWEADGHPVTNLVISGRHHFDVMDALVEEGPLFDATLALFRS